MSEQTIELPIHELEKFGINHFNSIYYQLSSEELIQDALRLGQGILSDKGALVIRTGEFTGRSPKDKYIVRDSATRNTIDWNEFNIPIEPDGFDSILSVIKEYLNAIPEIWIQDCYACADKRYQLSVRVITEKPWVGLFAHNMFLRPSEEELENYEAEWHIVAVPDLRLDASKHNIRQHNASVISFKHKLILIAGSGYTGETKKAMFTVLNYLLPQNKQVLSMHCSANSGVNGDTALFFGLSGTGKTTLSADPKRILIGDDEHGWSDNNIFNFEGGCYAKTIGLSENKEPEIFHAIRKGALLENTPFIPGTNRVDFSNKSITENTRVSYPIHFIEHAAEVSVGNIPKNLFFLTCDAYGVLPPVSKLTTAQAMYQFISGYTAKIAGTETGITEPKSTFSACFGAPFLPLHPGKYASMLGDKLKKNNVKVWMLNTGWTGGSYGTGHRIDLKYTRAMISAVLEGRLDNAIFNRHPLLGLDFPVTCPGVPSEILDPQNTWADKGAYAQTAKALASQFRKNFEKYADNVDPEIRDAGPQL